MKTDTLSSPNKARRMLAALALLAVGSDTANAQVNGAWNYNGSVSWDGINYFVTTNSPVKPWAPNTVIPGGIGSLLHFNNDITTTSSTRWDAVNSTFTGNLANGTKVRLTTGGTIPTPFNNSTDYYVVNASGGQFQLASSPGGGSIAITASGFGLTNFTTPDNSALAGLKSVYLDGARTVGQIIIGDLSGAERFSIEAGNLPTNNLIFDMGSVGGGNSFINKFQGGLDLINASIVLDDNLNVRVTTQILELGGTMSGAGTLTSYGNGRLRITGDSSSSTVPLWLWNRGTNNVNNNAQVELGATVGNAVGGSVRVGNASLGGNGHAVLQLQQGRTNLNQIKDSAGVLFDGINGRWAYMKLMGGNETVESIMDLTSGAVIENRESETLSTAATLTVNGTSDSRISAYLRNNAYNPFASLEPVADAAELANYNTAPLSLAKQGTGTMTLVGTNIYYGGTTTVSGGTLVLDGTTRFRSNVTNNSAVVVNINSGTWNFNFDHDGDQTLNPAAESPTALQNLSITGSGSLTKTGPGVFNLFSNNTIGGGLVLREGGMVLTGNNTITGGITVSGEPVVDRDLTLSGSNSIGAAFNVTGDYGAAGSTVTVSGVQTMNSASPANKVVNFTNTTAILNGTLGGIANATSITLAGRAGTSGIFRLDNDTNANSNRVTDTTNFISKGGAFNFRGGAGTDETLAQLNLSAGELQIAHEGVGKLIFSSLTRSPGATLRVDGALGMGTANQQVKFTSSPALANSLVGAWATVGKEWATYGGNGLSALGSYATGAESTWVNTQNVKASAAQTLGANRAVNSLNMQAAGNVTVTVNAATRVLSVASGGILASSSDATGRTHTLNNGIVTVPSTFASSGAELIANVHTGTLNFNSVIDESFAVTGTKSTSNTTITGLASTAGLVPGMRVEGLGIPANTTIASVVSGTSITLSATPTTAGSTSLTFSSGSVGVTKTGNGLLVLAGVNHYQGKTIVNQGTLRIHSSEANLGDNPSAFDASHLLVNGGTIQLNSSMTIDDANRGITVGDAGGRFEVGTADANVYTVNINSPITATGVFEVAVRGNQAAGTASILNLGNAGSSNVFGGGIKTEQFSGIANVNGSNTVGHIHVEAGELWLNGSNNLTGNIRMIGGVLGLQSSNTFSGSINISDGQLSLFDPNALGTLGFGLSLGNGTLTLNGTNQTVNAIAGNLAALIENDGVADSLLTLNLGYSMTYSGALSDGDVGSGALGLTKIGEGTLLLNNIASNFTGVVRISEGVLATTFVDYGGSSSPLGAGYSGPEALIVDGGGLRFDLSIPAVTDRSFTLGAGANGGTLAATGATREATITLGVDYTKSFIPFSSAPIGFEGSGDRTLTLGGFQAGYNLFNLPLNDKSSAEQTSLLKIGGGYWEIGRPNSYTGLTTVQEGRLAISADGALGTYIPSTSTAVSITSGSHTFSGNLPNGTPIHIAASTLPGNVLSDATYYVVNSTGSNFQISAVPTGDPINVSSSGSGVTYYNSQGAGVNLLGGALELKGVNYTAPEELLFEGGQLFAQIGNSTWSGPVSVNVNSTVNVLEGASIKFTGVLSGNRGITQAGEGTVVLSGEADPLTVGAVDNNRRFYSLNAGTLILDYSTNNNSKLVDQASLTLGGSRRGGTLRLVGGSSDVLTDEEIVAGTTIATGENAIYRDSGTKIIRLNTISRQPGATIYFDQPGIAKVDNLNTTANILGAWAVVRDPLNGDYDWAKNAGTADGLVIANSTYNTLTWAPNANTNVTTTNTRAANQTTYSLRFNGPNGATLPTSDVALTLSGGLNTIQSGGILVTPKMLTFNSIIKGAGDLTVGSEQQIPDFLINQYNPSGNLVIESRLVDDPNQPAATGTLFSGDTRRVSGLSSTIVSNLHVGMSVTGTGIPVGATITGFYSATDIQISTAYTGAAGAAVPDLAFVAHNGLEKLGPGTLILTGANTYSGVTTLADGVLTAGVIADGGLPSSLGASSAGAGNLVFNGGTLRYVGANAATDRGFTVNELARFEVGHESASLTMTGTVSGADRIEVGGPGTLVLTGAATATNHWLLDQGAAEFRMNTGNNRFATSLAALTVSGGALRVVGDPAADRIQQFGGLFTVAEGASEIRAISAVGGNAGRALTIQIGGVDEIFDVVRKEGGTVRFVEDPVEGGGAANITLAIPVLQRQIILPYATYQNTSDISQPGVNNFATVDSSNNAIVSADLLSLYDIGSFYNDPNNWTSATLNPSEGANGPLNGSLSANRTVGTLRFFTPEAGNVQVPSGRTLRIAKGAVMVGANVGSNTKQISGLGNLTGGLRSVDGNRDLMWHNYNKASTFLLGAKIIDDIFEVTGGGVGQGADVSTGSPSMSFGYAEGVLFNGLELGMVVTGPGIAPGTTISALDPSFFGITLSQPATADVSAGTFQFQAVTNFVQTGIGTTALSGTNTYTGKTFVHGGVLRLDSAGAVPGGIGATGGISPIIVEGGVIGLNSGNFTRSVGTDDSQVQFKGSGGFAAYGADRTVNFGGANAALAWGVNGFVPVGSSLILGSHDSTHKVTLTNPLSLGYGTQVVRVEDGAGTVDGELSGVVSGDAQLIKRGFGTLRLSGLNTFTGGTVLEEGTLIGANSPTPFGGITGGIEVGSTSFTDIAGQITLGIEGGTVSYPIHVGNVNAEGNSMIQFGDNGTLAGALSLDRNVFLTPVGAATRGTITGLITGLGGFTVTSTGNVIVANAANTIGGGGGAPGNAIDGSAIVRSGNLVVGATGALGTATVELGDALPAVFTVDRATAGIDMTLKGGYFDPLHNGTFSSAGPGAFVEVFNVIDGRTFTRASAGALVLVKDDQENPERNGVYQVVFYDIPVNSPDPQPANTMNLARVSGMDGVGEFQYGTRVIVTNGTVNAGKAFFIAGTAATPNVSAVNFREDVNNPTAGLLVENAGVDVTNPVDVNSTLGAGVAMIGGSNAMTTGTASFSGPVVMRDLNVGVRETLSLRVNSFSADDIGIVLGGEISEANGGAGANTDLLSLVKVGPGRLSITGANTYHGGTTVSEGTLTVNNTSGSATGSGLLTLDPGTVLDGNGTIGGDVLLIGTLGNPSSISPGDPATDGGIGTLTISGDVNFGANTGAIFTIRGDGDNDLLVASSLVVNASTLFHILFDGTYSPTLFDEFNLIDWTSAPSIGDIELTDNLDLPALPPALFWDTSLFNTSGVLRLVDAILPPTIVTQPQTQSVNPGVNVVLEVVPGGSGPFTYQWRKDGNVIAGATKRTLSLNAVTQLSEGSYTVTVTNVAGPTTSDPAVLSVNDPILITSQPTTQAKFDGELATFTVVATGTGPLTYQWQKDGFNIPLANSDTFSITANSSNTGIYRVLVTNVVGTVTSQNAALALYGPDAAILLDPVPAMLPVGGTLDLSVIAQGDAPLAYQWKRNNAVIKGATLANYTVPNVTTARAGAYNCVVTNTVGGIKKTATSLVVQVGVVDQTSKNFVLKIGSKVTFSVTAAGNNLTYQWMKDNVDIPGATAKSLALSGLQVADSGDYVCRVGRSGEVAVVNVSVLNCGTNNLRVYDSAPLVTHTPPLPAAVVSGSYSYQFPINSDINVTPTSFVASGLPAGLTMNKLTGLISGKPTVWKVAPYAVTVTVSNLSGKVVVPTTIQVSDMAANFVGAFAGPIERNAVLNGGLGGFFTMTAAKTGSVSGKLFLGAATYAFKGTLNTSLDTPGAAESTITVVRSKMTPLTLNFIISSTLGQISVGSITDGVDTVNFNGWRNPWSKTNPTTIFNGTYVKGAATLTVASAYHTFALTLPALSPLIGDASIPQGDGFASFSIASTTGALKISGKTADGQAILFSTFVGPSGEVGLFKTLYTTTNRGSLLGTLNIAAGSPAENNLLGGTVTWSRPALAPTSKERTYKDGFGVANPITLSAVGGRYVPPVSPNVILGVNPAVPDNASLEFTGANVGTPAPSPDVNVSIIAGSKLSLPLAGGPSNLRKTSLAVSPTTGAISGKFTIVAPDPLNPTKNITRAVAYQGLIVRDLAGQHGCGYFLLPQLPAVVGETSSNTKILSGLMTFDTP